MNTTTVTTDSRASCVRVRTGMHGDPDYHNGAIRSGSVSGHYLTIDPGQIWVELTSDQLVAYIEAFVTYLYAGSSDRQQIEDMAVVLHSIVAAGELQAKARQVTGIAAQNAKE